MGRTDLALRAIRQSLKAEPDNLSVLAEVRRTVVRHGGLRWGAAVAAQAQRSDATLPRIDYDIAATDIN